MADQGKWWKLWCSALGDDALENLSIHDWFGWVRLGAHMKSMGQKGKITFSPPASKLLNVLRVPTLSDAIDMIKRFPNYHVEEIRNVTTNVTVVPVTYIVKCRFFNKYQGDFSGYRVKRHRANVTANVTVQEEKRREEKRGDVEEKRITSTKIGAFTKPSALEVTAYAKGIGFELDGQRFIDHYEANGWKVGRNPMRSWQAAVRTWKNRNPGGSLGSHDSKGAHHISSPKERIGSLGKTPAELRIILDRAKSEELPARMRNHAMAPAGESQQSPVEHGRIKPHGE